MLLVQAAAVRARGRAASGLGVGSEHKQCSSQHNFVVALRPPVNPNIDRDTLHPPCTLLDPHHCIALHCTPPRHYTPPSAPPTLRRQRRRRRLQSCLFRRRVPSSSNSTAPTTSSSLHRPRSLYSPLPATTTPCSATTLARSPTRPPPSSPLRWPPALASATQHVRRSKSLAIARRSTHRQSRR